MRQGAIFSIFFFFLSSFCFFCFHGNIFENIFRMESDRTRLRYANPFSGAVSTGRSRFVGVRARAVGQVSYARGRRRAAAARQAASLGIEKKYFDTAVAAAAIAANADMTGGEVDPTALPGATLCLSSPAIGDGGQDREGRKILMKSIQVKGRVILGGAEGQASPAAPQNIFVALVHDSQTNGAQLNSEDVFSNLSAVVGGNSVPLRNMNYSDRFKVLRSACFEFNNDSLSHFATDSFSYNGISREFEWFVPLNMRVNFSGTTGVVGSVVDNSLHMIAFCNVAGPTITYNARMRFQG